MNMAQSLAAQVTVEKASGFKNVIPMAFKEMVCHLLSKAGLTEGEFKVLVLGHARELLSRTGFFASVKKHSRDGCRATLSIKCSEQDRKDYTFVAYIDGPEDVDVYTPLSKWVGALNNEGWKNFSPSLGDVSDQSDDSGGMHVMKVSTTASVAAPTDPKEDARFILEAIIKNVGDPYVFTWRTFINTVNERLKNRDRRGLGLRISGQLKAARWIASVVLSGEKDEAFQVTEVFLTLLGLPKASVLYAAAPKKKRKRRNASLLALQSPQQDHTAEVAHIAGSDRIPEKTIEVLSQADPQLEAVEAALQVGSDREGAPRSMEEVLKDLKELCVIRDHIANKHAAVELRIAQVKDELRCDQTVMFLLKELGQASSQES